MPISSGKANFSYSCAAECGAVQEMRWVAALDDELRVIIDAWPELGTATRGLLIETVEAELH